MAKNPITTTGVAVATLGLASVVLSYPSGVVPAGTGSSTSMTRVSSNTCGKCHKGSIGGNTTTVSPTARVLQPGQAIGITVKASSSVSGSRGGFSADVTTGTLVAGSNSKIRKDGKAIAQSNSRSRSWAFSYKAPTTPGLVEFYTVGMSSNGSGTSNDKWSFHGSSPTATQSTPVRFFVNAAGIKSVGSSCDDGYGNYSVLGAPSAPTVGNAKFSIEAHGLPPSSQAVLWLSVGGGVVPVDLKVLGASGCFLYTKLHLELRLGTSAGNASRSEGKIVLPTGIPNDKSLKGTIVNAQVAALDTKPKRSFPVITTNGIEFTVQ